MIVADNSYVGHCEGLCDTGCQWSHVEQIPERRAAIAAALAQVDADQVDAESAHRHRFVTTGERGKFRCVCGEWRMET